MRFACSTILGDLIPVTSRRSTRGLVFEPAAVLQIFHVFPFRFQLLRLFRVFKAVFKLFKVFTRFHDFQRFQKRICFFTFLPGVEFVFESRLVLDLLSNSKDVKDDVTFDKAK